MLLMVLASAEGPDWDITSLGGSPFLTRLSSPVHVDWQQWRPWRQHIHYAIQPWRHNSTTLVAVDLGRGELTPPILLATLRWLKLATSSA